MKKGERDLLKFAKKIVGKNIYKKLKKIKEGEELRETAHRAMVSSLKKDYHIMEIEVKKLEKQEKDIFFARAKLLRIPSKIKHFEANFDEGEFNRVAQSFKSVRREIENV